MVLSRLTAVVVVLAGCAPAESTRPMHPETRRDELRPTDTASTEMWRFLATDTVEHFDAPDSGYRVHFTRAGKNAVPAGDANANGIPDLVESVASVYDLVGAKYHAAMGFRFPLSDLALGSNGGSDRFDVYLLDFGLQADGAFRVDACPNEKCVGYVVQENDFVGYNYPNATVATRILGSHEYFHAIQAAYDNNQGVNFSEGTAVWATEQFDPSTNDFEGFLSGFMSRPDRSLDSPPSGPVPAFAYGSAIFFQFLSEKFGPLIIRKLWERCENGSGHPSEPADVGNPHWLIQLDALLKAEYQSSFAQAFSTFVVWNLFTGTSADATQSYFNGFSYPPPLITSAAAPFRVDQQRVFYAASAYFQVAPAGRTTMGAMLVDDPLTPNEDETQGMALVLAVRRNDRNGPVAPVADVKAENTVDTSGNAQLLVAVVNTAREGLNGVLSKRPGLCIGSPEELRACRIALDPTFDAGSPDAGPPDAGVADAGFDAGTPDAGTEVDGGIAPPVTSKGCGCEAASPALGGLLAVAWMLARRERPTA